MGVGDTSWDSGRTIPSSMRHKQILDLAAEQPDASFEAIADEVPSATADLVKTVLEKYGDPVEGTDTSFTEEATPTSNAEPKIDHEAESSAESESTPTQTNEDDLTPRQEEILQAIATHPEASQREIGEQLGITGATVCNHMSQIEDGAWENRQQLVTEVLESSAFSLTDEMPPTAADGSGVDPEASKATVSTEVEELEQLEQLQARVETLEQQVTTDQTSSSKPSVMSDPELMQKVLHACLNAETISEEEELKLIKTLM